MQYFDTNTLDSALDERKVKVKIRERKTLARNKFLVSAKVTLEVFHLDKIILTQTL